MSATKKTTLKNAMTDQHPITPPPELVRKWATWRNAVDEESFWRRLAIEAAQWGADQELEACCEWLAYEGHEHEHLALRAARRPKPPTLKEQALAALEHILHNSSTDLGAETIRRALEALPQ